MMILKLLKKLEKKIVNLIFGFQNRLVWIIQLLNNYQKEEFKNLKEKKPLNYFNLYVSLMIKIVSITDRKSKLASLMFYKIGVLQKNLKICFLLFEIDLTRRLSQLSLQLITKKGSIISLSTNY